MHLLIIEMHAFLQKKKLKVNHDFYRSTFSINYCVKLFFIVFLIIFYITLFWIVYLDNCVVFSPIWPILFKNTFILIIISTIQICFSFFIYFEI